MKTALKTIFALLALSSMGYALFQFNKLSQIVNDSSAKVAAELPSVSTEKNRDMPPMEVLLREQLASLKAIQKVSDSGAPSPMPGQELIDQVVAPISKSMEGPAWRQDTNSGRSKVRVTQGGSAAPGGKGRAILVDLKSGKRYELLNSTAAAAPEKAVPSAVPKVGAGAARDLPSKESPLSHPSRARAIAPFAAGGVVLAILLPLYFRFRP